MTITIILVVLAFGLGGALGMRKEAKNFYCDRPGMLTSAPSTRDRWEDDDEWENLALHSVMMILEERGTVTLTMVPETETYEYTGDAWAHLR
jgi:hypothetical protein